MQFWIIYAEKVDRALLVQAYIDKSLDIQYLHVFLADWTRNEPLF